MTTSVLSDLVGKVISIYEKRLAGTVPYDTWVCTGTLRGLLVEDGTLTGLVELLSVSKQQEMEVRCADVGDIIRVQLWTGSGCWSVWSASRHPPKVSKLADACNRVADLPCEHGPAHVELFDGVSIDDVDGTRRRIMRTMWCRRCGAFGHGPLDTFSGVRWRLPQGPR